MATRPSVHRIKKDKRDLDIQPPEGMSRRRFLTFLGTGSAALAAGGSGVLVGCAEGEEGGQQGGSQEQNGSSESSGSSGGHKAQAAFSPIEPTDEDDIKLPEGFEYGVIRSSGDSMGNGMVYGDHNDYVAYFSANALDGGDSSEDGLLWVTTSTSTRCSGPSTPTSKGRPRRPGSRSPARRPASAAPSCG